jgi:hypothetical protein
MPHGKKVVGERMGSLKLPGDVKEDVVAELAASWKIYQNARSRCWSDPVALELAMQEVAGWPILAARIFRAESSEDEMNTRTTALWLPGLATRLDPSLLLALLPFLGFRPRLVWIGNTGMLFYWPGLAGLPVFGARGAHLSRRAPGPTRAPACCKAVSSARRAGHHVFDFSADLRSTVSLSPGWSSSESA